MLNFREGSLDSAPSGEVMGGWPWQLGGGGRAALVKGDSPVPGCPAFSCPGRRWGGALLEAQATLKHLPWSKHPSLSTGARGEVTRATLHLDDECCSVNPFSVPNSTREAVSEEAVAPCGRSMVSASLWGTGRMVDQLESNCFECTSPGPLAVGTHCSLRGPGPGRVAGSSTQHLSWYLKGDRPCYIRFMDFE